MSLFSYNHLVERFGGSVAYQCLVEIEKAARIPSGKMAELDPEVRLENAIRAQDEMWIKQVLAGA